MSNKCHHFEITEMYRFDYFFPVVVVFFRWISIKLFQIPIFVSITMITFFLVFMDRNWIMILYFNEWIDHFGLVFILAIQSMMIMMMTIITHTHTWWKIPVCNDDRFFLVCCGSSIFPSVIIMSLDSFMITMIMITTFIASLFVVALFFSHFHDFIRNNLFTFSLNDSRIKFETKKNFYFFFQFESDMFNWVNTFLFFSLSIYLFIVCFFHSADIYYYWLLLFNNNDDDDDDISKSLIFYFFFRTLILIIVKWGNSFFFAFLDATRYDDQFSQMTEYILVGNEKKRYDIRYMMMMMNRDFFCCCCGCGCCCFFWFANSHYRYHCL